MIRAILRAILAWFGRSEPVQPDDSAARRKMRDDLRLRLLEQADELRGEARDLFRRATRAATFSERSRLYNLAIAAELRGEALHALAGGDAEAARVHTLDAAEYEARAGEPRPVVAAHA